MSLGANSSILLQLGNVELQRNIALLDFESDDYYVKTAKSLGEDEGLVPAGFEYVTEREDLKIYRKRK